MNLVINVKHFALTIICSPNMTIHITYYTYILVFIVLCERDLFTLMINMSCPPSYFFSQTFTPSSQQSFLEGISATVTNSVNTIIEDTLKPNLTKLINEKVAALESKEASEVEPLIKSIKELKNQQFQYISNFCLQLSLINNTLKKEMMEKSNSINELILELEESKDEVISSYQNDIANLKIYKKQLKNFVGVAENCKERAVKNAYNSLRYIIDHTN